MRDIAFTVHFMIRLLAHSLSLPPFCSHHRASALSPFHRSHHPLPQCPLTKFLSREKNLDTSWRHPHEERWNSRININRIPLLLILVADPSRRILTCKQSRTPSNTIVSSRGKSLSTYNRYRVDSVLSDRRLIGIF